MARARCPVCHLTVNVSGGGVLFAHEFESKRCAGTGFRPTELDPPLVIRRAPVVHIEPPQQVRKATPKSGGKKALRAAREQSAARAMLKALTPRRPKPRVSAKDAAKAAERFEARRAAAQVSRLRYEADMKARREADEALGRTPKPKKAPATARTKTKRSVWTVRGGLPGLGKRS